MILRPLQTAHHRRHDLAGQDTVVADQASELAPVIDQSRRGDNLRAESVLLVRLQAEDVVRQVNGVDLTRPVRKELVGPDRAGNDLVETDRPVALGEDLPIGLVVPTCPTAGLGIEAGRRNTVRQGRREDGDEAGCGEGGLHGSLRGGGTWLHGNAVPGWGEIPVLLLRGAPRGNYGGTRRLSGGR